MIRYLIPLKDLFLRNSHLKFISILLALLLWFTINGEPKSEIKLRVPLEYRNPPNGIEVLDDNVNAIDVRLSGPSRLVRRLEATDISAAIDLSDWSAGERTYSISPDNLRVPYGVNVTTITPNKVRLRFEPTQHKVVPIRPHLVGKVAEGFLVDTVDCHPNLAQIEGPGGHLSAVQSVSTDSIDVNGRSESFKRGVNLFIEDPLVRFSSDRETNVDIKIVPASVGKD